MILLIAALLLVALMVIITEQLRCHLPLPRFRQIMRLLILAYLLLNWTFTLFTRTTGEYPIVFVPFRALLEALGWSVWTFEDVGQLLSGALTANEPMLKPLVGIAQNIVLFLPFGFLLAASYRRMNAWLILLLGLLLSLFIECCQLFLQLGWFETDDLLNNTLGTLLGFWLYRRIPESCKYTPENE